MNFRFTFWKGIISLLAFVSTDFYMANLSLNELECMDLSCPKLLSEALMFDTSTVIISLVIGLIVYIIWSLFQKKRK